MSGSSGGGGGRPGGDGLAVDCDLVEKTVLNSPVGDVLRELKRGDALRVELHTEGKVRLLRALTAEGKVAGSLTPRQTPAIVGCLEKGNRYVAHVLRVSGGMCEVEIRRSGD